jgi:gluconolactonase
MGGESGRIFYVGPDWSIRTVSDGEVAFPNGIVLRPDGRTLLVAESLRNRVVQFRVRQAGVLGAPRVFTDLPSQPNPWTGGEAEPDGMALDEDGRLYVAHFGAGVVRVVDRTGRVLGSYGSASSSITNLAFGGPQRDELYLYAARGDSLEEFGEGGRIVVLTLPGTRGAPLLP